MISYSIEQHAEAYVSKVLATQGGAHIFNIQAKEDVDNGWFVGKGAWLSLDLYEEAAPTSASGIVREQAANGNWYVEITASENAYFVYTVPLIEEEYNNNFKKLSNFYNAGPVMNSAGTAVLDPGAVMRCYELKPGDIVEISADGFGATPTAGKEVSLAAITGVTYAQQLK